MAFFTSPSSEIRRRIRISIYAIFIVIGAVFFLTYPLADSLKVAADYLDSSIIKDRNGNIIAILPNSKKYFSLPVSDPPSAFIRLAIQKEDRFFYRHPGINPFSILRGAISYIASGNTRGSSTITQQLVKILFGNEQSRTLRNKLIEAVYAIALELHSSKREIITLYANAAYFGNRVQGIGEASRFYFNKSSQSLTDTETLALVLALGSPSDRYPGSYKNNSMLPRMAVVFGTAIDTSYSLMAPDGRLSARQTDSTSFEINSLHIPCPDSCTLSIDSRMTQSIREILRNNLNLPSLSNAEHGAVVVIGLPENELLSVVGSPNPESPAPGYQINMALRARPTGSTAKPFIYLKAFERGARPYSLVEDREYAYRIGTGFAFYPKNYDGTYRGTVSLHEALSNSLNVPSVKVLEFAGLGSLYDFFENSLGLKPIQPLENYELGIALGALETDLLTLSHFFTIFPNGGIFKPLRIKLDREEFIQTPMGANILEKRRVAEEDVIQLINKILSDRETSVDQFGMKSNLTLSSGSYALKTGTSRDYHDSWTIGYTPDFLVGVWVGNSDNTPMREISGQMGAGKIWHDVAELFLNSRYNKRNAFSFDLIREFDESGTIEYGLAGDDYSKNRLLLEEADRGSVIDMPHDADVFLFEKNTALQLISRSRAEWRINGEYVGDSESFTWKPSAPGNYTINAIDANGNVETIHVRLQGEE